MLLNEFFTKKQQRMEKTSFVSEDPILMKSVSGLAWFSSITTEKSQQDNNDVHIRLNLLQSVANEVNKRSQATL